MPWRMVGRFSIILYHSIQDRKSTRLNSSHLVISYAVFCLKKKRGHVQGLAQASLTRCLPGLATVLGWDGCDHLGPAFEGALLSFSHRLVDAHDHAGSRLLRFDTRAAKWGESGQGDDILAWSAVVLAP